MDIFLFLFWDSVTKMNIHTKCATSQILPYSVCKAYCSFSVVSLCNGEIKWQSRRQNNICFIYDQIAWFYVDTKQSLNPITGYCTQFKSK